jgi:hypothetical protein
MTPKVKDKREIRVSCDFDTNIAFVRIWKYRNYTWSGGNVYQQKRNSYALREIARIIVEYGTENKSLTTNVEFLYNGKSEIATAYNIDMGRNKKEIENA